MRMARRTKKIQGMVNFPVSNEGTQEGGMYVRLWAVPKNGGGLCHGTETAELLDSVFIGSDTVKEKIVANRARMEQEWLVPIGSVERVDELDALEKELDRQTTGQFFHETQERVRWSLPLAASVMMGSTGWSSGDFICTYDDLNDAGKQLYHFFKANYPHCNLHLLTFLDT